MFKLLSAGCAAILIVTAMTEVSAGAKGIYFKSSTIETIERADLIEDLRRSRIIIIGESHGNREHHIAQLDIIQGLLDSGAKVAVGMEVFRADSQDHLDAWSSGNLDSRDIFRVFGNNWSLDHWPVYRDILFHIKENGIPLAGLNVPQSLLMRVMTEGSSSEAVMNADLPAVECDVDARYRNILSQSLVDMGHGDTDFQNFCQAQVLRDYAMAHNALKFVDRHPDHIMVVLSGIFHAWKHGIASHLKGRPEIPYRVILPSSAESYLNYDIFLKDADYIWWQRTEPQQP